MRKAEMGEQRLEILRASLASVIEYSRDHRFTKRQYEQVLKELKAVKEVLQKHAQLHARGWAKK